VLLVLARCDWSTCTWTCTSSTCTWEFEYLYFYLYPKYLYLNLYLKYLYVRTWVLVLLLVPQVFVLVLENLYFYLYPKYLYLTFDTSTCTCSYFSSTCGWCFGWGGRRRGNSGWRLRSTPKSLTSDRGRLRNITVPSVQLQLQCRRPLWAWCLRW